MESRNSRCRPSLVASARSSADRAAVSSAASADAGAGSATPRSPAASFLAAWAVSVNGLVSHRARLSAATPATRRPTSRPSKTRCVALLRALPSSVTGSTDTIQGPAVAARASTSALPSVPWVVPEYVPLAESAARTSAVRYELAARVARPFGGDSTTANRVPLMRAFAAVRRVGSRSSDASRSACALSRSCSPWTVEVRVSGTVMAPVTRTATATIASITSVTRRRSEAGGLLTRPLGGVADAPTGDDGARVPELGPHLRDVDVDRTAASVVSLTPDRAQQLLARVHAPGRRHQLGQKVELGRRERHGRVVDPYLAARLVETDPAEGHDGRRGTGLAAQHALDPCDELVRRERFGDVVVAAQLQTEDAVDLVIASCDEQHWRPVVLAPERAADLNAVEAGESDVEHHGNRTRR